MDTYKGFKITDEVIIVENKRGQGYVVDPNNKDQLESARSWAEGGYYLVNKDPYKEYKYKNGKFKFSFGDSAFGSSQGGKLSFWNCYITAPDNKKFLIGINSDLLIDFIKENNFIKGDCQQDVWLGRKKNNVGVFTEEMESFKQAKVDAQIRNKVKHELTTKYEVGDIVGTLTQQFLYLGEMYQTFSDEGISESYWSRKADCVIFKKPKKVHVFAVKYDWMKDYAVWSYNIVLNKPRRIIFDHIDVDKEPYINKFFNEVPEIRDNDTPQEIGRKEHQVRLNNTYNKLKFIRDTTNYSQDETYDKFKEWFMDRVNFKGFDSYTRKFIADSNITKE